jgi:hypothetical protein
VIHALACGIPVRNADQLLARRYTVKDSTATGCELPELPLVASRREFLRRMQPLPLVAAQ